MEIPIIGQAGNEGHYPINFYYSPELEQGRPGLVGTPGLTKYATINSDGGEIRGAWDMDGVLYVVCEDYVYKYSGGVSTVCAGALLTSDGPVWMVDNGTQVMIVDNPYGYYVTGTTVTQITDADFPDASSLAYQDGYGIVTHKDTGQIFISGINDFSTWDALDYTTAEASPDDALSVFSDHRELHVFGSESEEAFYNSGNPDFPFERIQGGYIEKGIGASRSVVKADNGILWFTDRRQVVIAFGPGQSPTVLSTPQLHKKFEAYGTVSDAFAYGIDTAGFTWYVITFPSENITWVYNIAMKRWHQWAGLDAGVDTRHRSNCYIYYDGKHLVGDYQDGCLYQIDPFCYSDGGNSFRSSVIFPAIGKEGKNVFHSRLQVDFKTGVGLATGQGSDPQAALEWSDDQIRTWSNEHWYTIGKTGKYASRAIWDRLGSSRNRNYRVSMTDPVERVIYNPAFLEADIEDKNG